MGSRCAGGDSKPRPPHDVPQVHTQEAGRTRRQPRPPRCPGPGPVWPTPPRGPAVLPPWPQAGAGQDPPGITAPAPAPPPPLWHRTEQGWGCVPPSPVLSEQRGPGHQKRREGGLLTPSCSHWLWWPYPGCLPGASVPIKATSVCAPPAWARPPRAVHTHSYTGPAVLGSVPPTTRLRGQKCGAPTPALNRNGSWDSTASRDQPAVPTAGQMGHVGGLQGRSAPRAVGISGAARAPQRCEGGCAVRPAETTPQPRVRAARGETVPVTLGGCRRGPRSLGEGA